MRGAVTIEKDGIKAYLDHEYGDGAFDRFVQLLVWRWPRTEIGREFRGRRRQTVNVWIAAMKKEGLWREEYDLPTASKT